MIKKMDTKDDIFNNPMVDVARKALSPEQQEEYKRVGEYMYNTEIYKLANVGSKVTESKTEDLVLYATQALKSGGDPCDLTDKELRALIEVYGDRWYERFDIEEKDTRLPAVQFGNIPHIPRQQRRAMERKVKKMNKKL